MIPLQESDIKALVIRSSHGDVVAAALQNAKAFRKSLENNELWVYQAEGGRVLPYNNGSNELRELHDRGTWYEAVVSLSGSGSGEGAAGEKPLQAHGDHAATAVVDSATGAGPGVETLDHGMQSEATLERLANIIGARRRDMPEGSYTSYLFREGEDKIRKKTGEEAIELILAQKTEDIRNEAADLIYHLLVLLEVCDIPVQGVMDVLRGRE
ncbi:MAG: phosphoribosyl-ATP diphosphatase [Spirochaetaceae bacterium]|nr:MAG: phosphoribosyl-ATP diphosphatase [Spirochaetaceae bacterium]